MVSLVMVTRLMFALVLVTTIIAHDEISTCDSFTIYRVVRGGSGGERATAVLDHNAQPRGEREQERLLSRCSTCSMSPLEIRRRVLGYVLCTTEGNKHLCKGNDKIRCHNVAYAVDCALKLERDEVQFAVFSEEEMMLLARMQPYAHKVVASIRKKKNRGCLHCLSYKAKLLFIFQQSLVSTNPPANRNGLLEPRARTATHNKRRRRPVVATRGKLKYYRWSSASSSTSRSCARFAFPAPPLGMYRGWILLGEECVRLYLEDLAALHSPRASTTVPPVSLSVLVLKPSTRAISATLGHGFDTGTGGVFGTPILCLLRGASLLFERTTWPRVTGFPEYFRNEPREASRIWNRCSAGGRASNQNLKICHYSRLRDRSSIVGQDL
ncbi:hypothetical protein EVAR_64380_1 [Eumeta japonica]|uniref:Uncharacterized protein n=1 Tax=Eumeta variegata TaxID=151549 RepID=A0A4C1SHJ8_EUMVA|nr:hypothetical protein EVAR_64380_1 [Eumeta japonica]